MQYLISYSSTKVILIVLLASGSLICFSKINEVIKQHFMNRLALLHNKTLDIGYDFTQEKFNKLIVSFVFISTLIGLVFSVIFAVILPIVSMVGLIIFIEYKTKDNNRKLLQNNDELCYTIARTLRTGQSLEQSIGTIKDSKTKYQLVEPLLKTIDLGVPFIDSIAYYRNKSTSDIDQDLFKATLVLGTELGGNCARIFERLGDSYLKLKELEQESASAISQVKLSAIMISLLPLVMVVFTGLSGSDAFIYLFSNPLGIGLLVCGTILEVLGVLWMRKQIIDSLGVWFK